MPLGIPVEEMSYRQAYAYDYDRTERAIIKIEAKKPIVFQRIRNNICIIYKVVYGVGIGDVSKHGSAWVMEHMNGIFERLADKRVPGQNETLYSRDIWHSLSFCASPYNMAKLLLVSCGAEMRGNLHQPWQRYVKGTPRVRSEDTETRFAPQDDETYIVLTALTRQVSFFQDNHKCLNPYAFGGIKKPEDIKKHASSAYTKSKELFCSSKDILHDLCWTGTLTVTESDTPMVGPRPLPLDHEERAETEKKDSVEIVTSMSSRTRQMIKQDDEEIIEEQRTYSSVVAKSGNTQKTSDVQKACANSAAAVEKLKAIPVDDSISVLDSTASSGVRDKEVKAPRRTHGKGWRGGNKRAVFMEGGSGGEEGA